VQQLQLQMKAEAVRSESKDSFSWF